MQWRNITQELFYGGGSAASPLTGTPMLKNYEYGGDAGGPIVRNRLWYWGAARRQLINNRVVGLLPVDAGMHARAEHVRANQGDLSLHASGLDGTQQPERQGQLPVQLGQPVPVPVELRRQGAERTRRQRDPAAGDGVRPVEHPTPFMGTPTYNVKHTWVLSDKLVFDSGFNHTDWRIPAGLPGSGASVQSPANFQRRHGRLEPVVRSADRGTTPGHRGEDRQQLLLVEPPGRGPPGQVRGRYKMWKTGSRRSQWRRCGRAVRRSRRRRHHARARRCSERRTATATV